MESYPAILASDDERAEETLDPANWDELRSLGHRMLDDMLDYLATVRARPAWQPVPESVKARLDEKLPVEPMDAALVYEEFKRSILPYPTGNIHPRFWGWVMGTGTPLAMLADMLASGFNPHIAGYDQAATLIERQVVAWLTELVGMPRQSSGLLVSGGTMANIVGLVVARNAKAGFDVRQQGLQDAVSKLVLYGSTETHSWAQKAVELMGLGNEAFRRIPVDENFEIELGALKAAHMFDLANGSRPFCVIGNAGTVNTGATDDLAALADFCRQHDLWFHVDGAFGALAALSPKLQPVVAGMEQADSLAFDLHKWMYLPYEIGCALVRDRQSHRDAFELTPSYLTSTTRGIAVAALEFAELGIQLSRGFRALKAWMSLKTHGTLKYRRLIEQNVEQAGYLERLIDAHPRLELLAPVPLNVVCFRFIADGLDDAALNALNEEILLRVQESGVAVPSSTMINKKFALRVAITNHRSRRADFDILVETVAQIGNDIY
jgi:glutamate/tyrosine decarboxylase-like PLP-dependent enzyme